MIANTTGVKRAKGLKGRMLQNVKIIKENDYTDYFKQDYTD